MVLTFENNLNVNTNIKGNLNINSNINVRKNISLEGNLLLFGDMCVDDYINFGKVLTKSDGYGIRDNSGNIQIKSDGGSWSNILTNPTYTLEVYGNLSLSTNSNVLGNMNITNNLNVSGDANINGRVGIGTANPLSSLDLGTSVSSQKLALYNNNWNTAGGAGFYGFGTGSSKMDFHANTAEGGTPQMVLNSSGYVGIGTTNPSSKLDVNGSIRAGYDTNTTSYFGRSAIGYGGLNDYATFSHINWNTSTQYALLQNNNGETALNSASGREILFKTGNINRMKLSAAGQLSIGMSQSPSYLLQLQSDSAGKPSTNTWTISSDIRIKQNITTITKDELFNISKNFEPKRYNFTDNYRKAHNITDKSFVGIIADEVKEYMPCCVHKNDLKFKIGEDEEGNDINEEIKDCYNYNGCELQFILFGCIPYLIKENEEQQTTINNLSTTINDLLTRIEALENL